jgi:predicted transport protein
MPPNAHDAFYADINAAARAQAALIRLVDGAEWMGAHIQVTADSVTWLMPDPATRQLTRRRSVSTSAVREIVVTDRKKSGIRGAGLGGLAGFLFGAVPAMINRSGATSSLSKSILLFGGLFGAAGGIGGAVAGYKKGQKDIYIFSEHAEGSQDRMLSQQLKGAQPGMDDLLARLRGAIRGLKTDEISEEITPKNIIFRAKGKPFCFLMIEQRRVNIYLAVRQQEVSDPQGLLRRWSVSDSWFSISPGGDFEYAMSLIRQVYERTL